ncbi:FecR family protein [Sphingobacterium siyangense]|uniref:FecR family protein n=1 Tax=Sphingobacterium siyangense TaxID=459529 RepID=UPI002FDCC15F
MQKVTKELLARYRDGACTPEETKWIESFILQHDIGKQNRSLQEDNIQQLEQQIKTKIFERIGREHRIKRLKRWTWTVAASVLIGVTFYFQLRPTFNEQKAWEQVYISKATTPGKQVAILKLNDGRVIPLDKYQGTIANTNKAIADNKAGQVLKYKAGQLAATEDKVEWDELMIPRGAQYSVILSDGTKVKLNSATTLKYPTHFDSHERVVYLSGEAYFEVSKDVNRPFKVESKGHRIEVTGTVFNVRAYYGEAEVETSLVEGGVNMSNHRQMMRIFPGEQVLSISADAEMKKNKINLETTIGWIKGDFVFENKNIRAIMKDVERWYNVDITFEGNISSKTYGGSFTKEKGLKELLNQLAKITGCSFNIQGRRVMVKA